MNTKILSIAALLSMSLASCHDQETPIPSTATGNVSLASLGIVVNNAEKVVNSESARKAKSRATLDLSNYIVNVSNAQGTVEQWKYADMPEIFALTPGDYTVTVKSHEVQKAAWDAPYFVGSSDFTVVADDITEVGVVTCSLANIKVSIKYSEELQKYMGDDVQVKVVANDEGELTFTPDETRSGYFEAIEGSSTLVAEFNGTVNGTKETLRCVLTDVEAGQHRIITFVVKTYPDVIPDENGNIDAGGIAIDYDVDNEDLNASVTTSEENIDASDRPGKEENDNTNQGGDNQGSENQGGDGESEAATITITSDQLSFTEANDVAKLSTAVAHIHADNGFANIIVTMTSTNEDFQSQVASTLTPFDLAYPGDKEDSLKQLGFKTGDEVIGQTDLDFDITAFLPLLPGFPGRHEFVISVTDTQKQQLVKSLVLVVNN